MARAYASIALPISAAALAEVTFGAPALGALEVDGLLRTAVEFGGAALTGGTLDDVALGGTAPDAAPPFAGGFTVGCVVLAGATFGG